MMAAMQKKMDEMEKEMNKLKSSSNRTRNMNYIDTAEAQKDPKAGRVPTSEEASTMSYCWSHGYCHCNPGKEDHNSSTCKKKGNGHKDESTADNKMGGETRLCSSWLPWHKSNKKA
jgi:hypothetical protein